jgi:predicted N-acetyltransferase YhbS
LIRRRLRRDELDLLWTIDRSEVVERIYELRDGQLVSRPDFFDIRGWPPGDRDHLDPALRASFDRGGAFMAIFDGAALIAAAVVDTKPLGEAGDLVQLSFLHVARTYRGSGLGVELFEAAQAFAADLGAAGLYVSATPSEHTIDWYRARGCSVTASPDPGLLALEPEDIHLECRRAL